MKRLYLILILALLPLLSFGQDDLKIRVHDRTHLKWNEEYSQKHVFDVNMKEFDRAILELSLSCPEGGCSNWDYSISVLLRDVVGEDTVDYQLGRMITPYGGWYNMGKNSSTWWHTWSWDISGYVPLLKDSVEIVVKYEGWQDGFMATTDFVFQKGGGALNNVIDVENIHYGYFSYGNINQPIDTYVMPKKVRIPKGTKKVFSRVMISGHGADSTNASAEFLKKDFYYMVNGEMIDQKPIWKDDCGCNPIQPQGGTWIYNRAGWCPGTVVNEFIYDLTPYINRNRELELDIDFEYYNTPQIDQPGYNVSHDVFFLRKGEIEKFVEKEPEPKIYNLPSEFVIQYKTNNFGERNELYIKDSDKNIYERTQMRSNTVYRERMSLADGCYEFRFIDTDCNGLSWWANPKQGNGYILIYNKDETEILEAFDPDFGCRISYNFLIGGGDMIRDDYKVVSMPDIESKLQRYIVFLPDNKPNKLSYTLKNRESGDIVLEATLEEAKFFDIRLDLSDIESGVYVIEFISNDWSEASVFRN